MASDEPTQSEKILDQQARVLQIIAGALISGVTVFLVVVLFMRSSGGKGLLAADPWNIATQQSIISLMSLVMSATLMVASFLVPNRIAASMRAQIAAGKLPEVGTDSAPLKDVPSAFRMVYQLRMIIGLAMLEGAAFFCLIAFLLEGRLPPLIAVGVLILLMVARFPSRDRIDRFVEDQQALILEGRLS